VKKGEFYSQMIWMLVKTGEQVIDVLQSKHPDAQIPEASELEDSEIEPNFVDLDITKEVVKNVA
jgi:hypothetical protein